MHGAALAARSFFPNAALPERHPRGLAPVAVAVCAASAVMYFPNATLVGWHL